MKRLIVLFVLISCFPVHCFVRTTSIRRQAELALKRYYQQPTHDPIVHSLLNVLIHDEHSKAFISDQAVHNALKKIKEFDPQTESALRQIIYSKRCPANQINCPLVPSSKAFQPTEELKEKIISALDEFFDEPTSDE